MNPLILSLVCLLLVGVSANWLSIVKNNKTLIYLSLAPCIYIAIYGIYLVIGPVDLWLLTALKNVLIRLPTSFLSWPIWPCNQ